MLKADTTNIEDFFKKGALIIPDYQRQYSWEKEQVLTLLSDLKGAFDKDAKYFIGNIIYTNIQKDNKDDNDREIIDGQQRLTTLMLILKNLHKSFTGFIDSIKDNKYAAAARLGNMENCLWLKVQEGKERIIPEDITQRNPVLKSYVYLSNYDVFFKLLTNQDLTKEDQKSNYYKNYHFIEEEIKTWNAYDITSFCGFILENVKFSIIEANEFGEAIDVFSNLNAKGIPLTDVDIFKARIMSAKKTEDDKKDFSEWWNGNLCDTITRFYDKNKIDDVLMELFTIYQYHLLALERKGGKDENAIIPKLRNYFIDNAAAKLANYYYTNVKDYLEKYLYFQKIFDNTRKLKEEDWQDIKITDIEIRKLLDVLSYHPYKNIKRPVCIYHFLYNDKENFQDKFKKFLKRYIVYVVGTYIYKPDTDSLKNEIIPIIIKMLDSDKPSIPELKADPKMQDIVETIRDEVSNEKLIRTLLAIYSYSLNEQKVLLPYDKGHDWEIEHIFPQKFDYDAPEMKKNKDRIEDVKEHIGNKLPLYKKTNIKAGNKRFESKRIQYEKSWKEYGNAAAKEMSEISQAEGEKWFSPDVISLIYARGEKIADKIKSKFEEWIDQYSKQ